MSSTKRGLFLSLEGIDGAGKSTQIRLLVERLRASGREVVESVEPGGSRISRRIREVILDPATPEMSPATEILLYFAARAQNVDEVLRPALARGAVIVSDRFTDSTLAYQGGARGLGEALVRDLDAIACREIRPQLTLLLDIDPAISARRSAERNKMRAQSKDRLEEEPDAFRARVRQAYLALAAAEPERIRVIDGSQPEAAVAAAIWSHVAPHV